MTKEQRKPFPRCLVKSERIQLIREYLAARKQYPNLARFTELQARDNLQLIGGIESPWRNDYSECTYYHPQRINGVLVDLSTVEKVRRHYERI